MNNKLFNNYSKYKTKISFILIINITILINIRIYKKYFYNDKKPKVSVFMPIYNKEPYLEENIKILQKQTLKEIEIIFVNDASTDNTGKLIKKLEKIERRIKTVNNDRNHGLLYSRAMGILNSTGEYLINLDPDDQFCSPDDLQFLYNQAKRFKIDTIKFSMLIIKRKKMNNYNNRSKINRQRKLYELNNSNIPRILNDKLITNKFIKREVIIRCFNAFKDKIFRNKWNYHEDNIWSILIYKYSKSIKFIRKKIYLYFQNKESLMHNRFNSLEMKNIIYRFEKVQEIFKYKNSYYMYNFLKQMKRFYHKIIKKDQEIRKKIINTLIISYRKNLFSHIKFNKK